MTEPLVCELVSVPESVPEPVVEVTLPPEVDDVVDGSSVVEPDELSVPVAMVVPDVSVPLPVVPPLEQPTISAMTTNDERGAYTVRAS
jgi:hypothetical protein